MRLVQVRRERWVVYDENDKVVIITHHRRIAADYMRSMLNGRQTDKEDDRQRWELPQD